MSPNTSAVSQVWRPEQELLLLGARTQRSTTASARFRSLVEDAAVRDWNYVMRQTLRLGVGPLLLRSLHREELADKIPEAALRQLESRARSTALRNLRRTSELLRVLDVLASHGVHAMPFKGPVLGVASYGDPSLRRFGDLDILVSVQERRRARDVLVADGYSSYYSMSAEEQQEHFGMEKSYELVRDGTLIELHWEFLHPMHGSFLDPDEVRSRAQEVAVGGRPVRTLALDDLLVYLCAHGSKHFWWRLTWVCDVAETLRAHQETLDWPALIRRARELHAGRMLLLGLLLASDLLEAPVPSSVKQAARGNLAVRKLACRVKRELFEEPTEEKQPLHEARFHLKMRERFRDRLPYYRHLMRLSTEPTNRDRAWITLDPSLDFAYYLIRPFRLAKDGLGHLFN